MDASYKWWAQCTCKDRYSIPYLLTCSPIDLKVMMPEVLDQVDKMSYSMNYCKKRELGAVTSSLLCLGENQQCKHSATVRRKETICPNLKYCLSRVTEGTGADGGKRLKNLPCECSVFKACRIYLSIFYFFILLYVFQEVTTSFFFH